MPDSFTEVTSEGFLTRLGKSFAGLIIGPILVIAAVALLWWNEGRSVQAIVGLSEAGKAAVESQPDGFSPANEGKLIHVIGPATAHGPIKDSDLNLEFADQVAVTRDAEMYQWREHEESHTEDQPGGGQRTTTTYTYDKGWSTAATDSSSFKHTEGHENPPMPFGSQRFTAGDAKLGAYTLDEGTVGLFDLSQALKPEPPQGWVKSGEQLYKGDAAAPKVGDMRVRYEGLSSGTIVSVLAAQSQNGFAPFVAANGYQVHLAVVGDEPAALMIANQKKVESIITWLLRGGGAIVMFMGFTLFLSPLATFASFIPFLGAIVRGAAAGISFVITVPLTLVVIALAWLAYRPIIGGGLLVLAAALLYGLWRWHKARRPLPSPAAAAKPT